MHFISPNSTLGRWLAFLLDALLISVAWAICSLPVITLGAATAALNKVAMNWMKDRSGCTLGDFFRAFNDQFIVHLQKQLCLWELLAKSFVHTNHSQLD